jgi:hypothetical protein
MGKTIVFIHGAWVTPLCWEKMSGYINGWLDGLYQQRHPLNLLHRLSG